MKRNKIPRVENESDIQKMKKVFEVPTKSNKRPPPIDPRATPKPLKVISRRDCMVDSIPGGLCFTHV